MIFEIEFAIKSIKNIKAYGTDGIVGDKYGGIGIR